MQDIGRVVAYFAQQLDKYCYRLVESEDDMHKLEEMQVEFQTCDVQTLLRAAEMRSCEPISLTVKAGKLLVFHRKFEGEVNSLLSSFFSQAISLSDRRLVVLLGTKLIAHTKKKFGCELKLLPCGTAVIKGPKENVSRGIALIEEILKDLIYRIVLSSVNDSFS